MAAGVDRAIRELLDLTPRHRGRLRLRPAQRSRDPARGRIRLGDVPGEQERSRRTCIRDRAVLEGLDATPRDADVTGSGPPQRPRGSTRLRIARLDRPVHRIGPGRRRIDPPVHERLSSTTRHRHRHRGRSPERAAAAAGSRIQPLDRVGGKGAVLERLRAGSRRARGVGDRPAQRARLPTRGGVCVRDAHAHRVGAVAAGVDRAIRELLDLTPRHRGRLRLRPAQRSRDPARGRIRLGDVPGEQERSRRTCIRDRAVLEGLDATPRDADVTGSGPPQRPRGSTRLRIARLDRPVHRIGPGRRRIDPPVHERLSSTTRHRHRHSVAIAQRSCGTPGGTVEITRCAEGVPGGTAGGPVDRSELIVGDADARAEHAARLPDRLAERARRAAETLIERDHRRLALSAARRSEPFVVVDPEIAVAVCRTGVAETIEACERRRVRLIRGIAVQGRSGVIPHVDGRAAARRVRRVLDELNTGLLREARRLVRLQLLHPGIDLRGQPGEGGVAWRRVRTGHPHRVAQRHVARGSARGEALLLLQGDQDDLRGDAARDLDAIDPFRDRHGPAGHRFADHVPRRDGGAAGIALRGDGRDVQAQAVAARADLRLQEILDLLGRHRGRVVEQLVGDDQLRVEVAAAIGLGCTHRWTADDAADGHQCAYRERYDEAPANHGKSSAEPPTADRHSLTSSPSQLQV